MKKIPYIENWEQWKESFRFYCPIKVRFGETDLFGHLNNANAFVYFEEARIDYLKERGVLQYWIDPQHDLGTVVANIHCDFIKQVYFDQKLKVYVKISEVGNSSFEIQYMVLDEKGEVCLAGRNTVVQFSRSSGRSVPLSPEMKRKLEEEISIKARG